MRYEAQHLLRAASLLLRCRSTAHRDPPNDPTSKTHRQLQPATIAWSKNKGFAFYGFANFPPFAFYRTSSFAFGAATTYEKRRAGKIGPFRGKLPTLTFEVAALNR
jgi:hypothetical protein